MLQFAGATMARKVLAGPVALGLLVAPLAAQAQEIDSDLVKPGQPVTSAPVTAAPAYPPAPAAPYAPPPAGDPGYPAPAASPMPAAPAPGEPVANISSCAANAYGQTYRQEDLMTAAEGVFGSGAHGLATMIQDILAKQGQPNGYITGREASVALVAGVRYGSGILCSKTIGRMPVYWTGPSIGFDAGGNAARTFVLVYNLRTDSELFRRYVAGEGQAYLVGGFHVSYLRNGPVVLIPVRMGVGLRLGINGGYMKLTRRLNYLPF